MTDEKPHKYFRNSFLSTPISSRIRFKSPLPIFVKAFAFPLSFVLCPFILFLSFSLELENMIVLTGGKFNRVHKGHIWLLKKAKSLGDSLVVVLANDSHNKRSYAMPARMRKKHLDELGIADYVVIGDKKNFFKVIEKIKPSIIVLGYDQSLPEGIREKLGKKIRVVKFRKHGDYSSGKMAL
jgi:FAD synthetase